MFLEIQPTVVSLLWRGLLVVHSRELLRSGDDAIEFERAASKTGCFRGTHEFYPRLVAYGYFWLSERA